MDRDELLKALWYGFPRPDFMHFGELERAPIRMELVEKISMALPPSDKAQEVSVIKEGLIFSSAGTGCWDLNKPACVLEDNYPSDTNAADGLAKMLGLQLSIDTIELKAELLSVVFYKGNQVNKSLKAHKEKYFATMVIHLPLREGAVLTMHYGERSVQGRKGCAVHTFFGVCKLVTQDDSAAGSCLVFGLTNPQVCEASPSFLHALVKTKELIHPWLEQTDPMVLAFVLPRFFLEDCGNDKLVIVELLRNCGLELHFAKIKTQEFVTATCSSGSCDYGNWETYDTPIANEWRALDGTRCFHGEQLVLHNHIIVEQSGTSGVHHDAPLLVAWPAHKKVQAVSLIDFPLSVKLLKEGSQDVEVLNFLITKSERRASYPLQGAELLSFCLDWEQKDLALYLIKHVEDLTEAWGEPLARAVSTYGWEECDVDNLILEKGDLGDDALASMAIHLESCGCHAEAVKVVDQLWTAVGPRRCIAVKAKIILLPRMLEQESLQESLQEITEYYGESALQIMRKSAGLIQLREDARMRGLFTKLVRNLKASGEAIQSSLWLGDASLVDEVMKELTGGEDYVGQLLQDHDFTSELSTVIKRRGLRRLVEMRLAFLGSKEPEYTYAPKLKKKVEEQKLGRLSYSKAYSEFKRSHMKWVREFAKLKELLQVLNFFEERTHSAFSG